MRCFDDRVHSKIVTCITTRLILYAIMTPMKRSPATQRGFTLVELMVVIAVLALLGTVAMPIFSNYMTRARATEFQTAATPARTALTEWAMLNPSTSAWPADASQLPSAAFSFRGDYVTSLSYQRATDSSIAAVVVSGQVDGNDIEVFFEGNMDSGRVTWRCTAAQSSLSWLPPTCQSPVSSGL